MRLATHRFPLALPAIACCVLFATFVPFVDADVVYLAGGGKFEGKVTEDSAGVHVQLLHGSVTFPKERVSRIDLGPCRWEVYAEKAKALSSTDAAGHLDLAQWCRQNDLGEFETVEYKAVLAVDTDNEAARKALGFVRYDGKWMTQVEAWKAMGWVDRKGKWMPPKKARYLDLRDDRLARQAKAQQAVDKGLDLIWKPKPEEREKGKELLIAAGKEHGLRGLEQAALQLADYYEQAWQQYVIDSADVTMDVRTQRATLTKLRTVDINPPNGVLIQLPQVDIQSVHTTVIAPARATIRVFLPVEGEEADLKAELGDDLLR